MTHFLFSPFPLPSVPASAPGAAAGPAPPRQARGGGAAGPGGPRRVCFLSPPPPLPAPISRLRREDYTFIVAAE